MSLALHTAFAPTPLTQALHDGRVRSDRVSLNLVPVEPITRAFRRMVRTLEFDLCEIAVSTLAQAAAYGKPLVGLPVVLSRGFHHGAILCRHDSPIRNPADLAGKRVAVRAYSQTTGVWLRGIFQDEYGLNPAAVTWVTEEDAHVSEYSDPPNVVRAPDGSRLLDLLMSGGVDAAIGLRDADPAHTRPLIADPTRDATAWFRKTGVFPVNHMLALKRELHDSHPWLAAELMAMFKASKAAAGDLPPSPITGGDAAPYGIAANRKAIDTLLRYTAEQGLTPRRVTTDEIFLALE